MDSQQNITAEDVGNLSTVLDEAPIKFRFSLSTGCFYPSHLNYASLPIDLIDVSDADYAQAVSRPVGATLNVIDGRLVIVNPPEMTAKQLADIEAQAKKAAIDLAIQQHLDKSARAMGYDDIKSAVTYADEPAVPLFQQQGRAFRAWRSLVWAAAAEIEAAVKSGSRPFPEVEEVLAELPALSIE
jgi:phosphoglycolate phosphatase-like HAD superfamily hydrolase